MTKHGDRTLVFSVLYPGLPDSMVSDYINSMSNQTDRRFDWLMINDQGTDRQREMFPGAVKWIDADVGLSFGKVREIGISFAAANGYDQIVFSDIDDYYSGDRVEMSKRYLK